ncbi:hypothetical protein E9993_13040 [Labilibacter sediminis]|nr:hypothetical protein E9993_13040 [Labilibacter sediminis]
MELKGGNGSAEEGNYRYNPVLNKVEEVIAEKSLPLPYAKLHITISRCLRCPYAKLHITIVKCLRCSYAELRISIVKPLHS